MVTRGYENYSCGMRRMLRAFYNKNWCSRVFILEDDATRRDKRVRCLAGMVLWKAVSPLARHLQPALRDRHLATSRSFAAGGGGSVIRWTGAGINILDAIVVPDLPPCPRTSILRIYRRRRRRLLVFAPLLYGRTGVLSKFEHPSPIDICIGTSFCVAV